MIRRGYINDPWDPLQVAVTGNPNNDTEWSNADYDRAFADAEKAPNDAQRYADFDTMEKLIGAHAPYASLYFLDRARLVQPSVLNWRDTPVGAMNWSEFSLADK
jgi:oligopeptide transport system substrate-binding protein